MEVKPNNSGSGTAGKPGESTAAAPSAASVRPDSKDLTRDGIASLLASEFADPEPVEPAPTATGEEVPPAATGEVTTDPNATEETPPAPEETTETQTQGNGLPEHLEAELQQWEQSGGTLPASLQKLVEKRIGKVVGEREAAEQRATQAEAEVNRLTGELEQASTQRGNTPAALDSEQVFTAKVNASKKFLKDARPYVGGYANDEQRDRIEKFMQQTGMDANALRQQMDEVGDWLTTEVPRQQLRIQQFKQAEAATEPLVQKRFASMLKPNTPEAKLAAEVLSLVPELKSRTPAHKLALGTYVLGKLAAEHLLAANPDSDVVETLKSILTKAAPIPAKGAAKPAVLPGKAPVRTPTGSPLGGNRAPVNSKDAQQEQASDELRKNPTAENVAQSLKLSLRA